MEFNLDTSGETGTLVLKGDLTIRNATKLKTVLVNAIESVQHCELDLSDVTAIDLSCIQLLYATWKTAEYENKKFSLKGECPEVFKKSAEEAGYSDRAWLCFND